MAAYRYVRWLVNERQSFPEDVLQVADFRLRHRGSVVAWDPRVDCQVPEGTFGGGGTEGPDKLVDNNSSTKMVLLNFALSTGTVTGYARIVIDNKVPIEFDAYDFVTGNDFPGRDPATWTLEGSEDGVAWTMLDWRVREPITSSRGVATQVFDLRAPYEPIGPYSSIRRKMLRFAGVPPSFTARGLWFTR
jgi:hypothetical protein